MCQKQDHVSDPHWLGPIFLWIPPSGGLPSLFIYWGGGVVVKTEHGLRIERPGSIHQGFPPPQDHGMAPPVSIVCRHRNGRRFFMKYEDELWGAAVDAARPPTVGIWSSRRRREESGMIIPTHSPSLCPSLAESPFPLPELFLSRNLIVHAVWIGFFEFSSLLMFPGLSSKWTYGWLIHSWCDAIHDPRDPAAVAVDFCGCSAVLADHCPKFSLDNVFASLFPFPLSEFSFSSN